MGVQRSIGDAVFYPALPERLWDMVRTSLNTLESEKSGVHTATLPAALITPHAAYSETAELMGAAFGAVKQTHPERIIILAPLHGDILKEDSGYSIFSPDVDAFALTDIEVPIDKEYIKQLTHDLPAAAVRNSYFDEEPAIELQLPYIHALFPGIAVAPFLIGDPTEATTKIIASLLNNSTPKQTLYVISSHLTNYLPHNTAAEHAVTAKEYLNGSLLKLTATEALRKNRLSMCGAHIVEGFRKSGIIQENWTILKERQMTLSTSDSASVHTDHTTFALAAVSFLHDKSVKNVNQ